MRRLVLCGIAGLVVVALLIGCGGGSAVARRPVTDTGTATGKVSSTGGQATGFKLKLDGAEIPVPIASDGSFTIPKVPVGSHVLDVIGPDGMSGGRAEFNIDPGEIEIIPPIEVKLGGQIVGMVMKREGDVLTPLVGVQVTARSDLIWIMTGDGKPSVGSSTGSGGTGLIYPPPEGQSYSAFTDVNGSYIMPAVASGSYLVTVAVPGLESGEQFVWVEPGKTAVADFELEVAIEPGVGTVEGTVYGVDEDGSNSAPLEGALVEVTVGSPWRPVDPGDPIIVPMELSLPGVAPAQASDGTGATVMPPDMWWRTFSTLTDASGHYSLNVPSGRVTVSASAYDYSYESQSIIVYPKTTATVNFKLTRYPVIIEPPIDDTTTGR